MDTDWEDLAQMDRALQEELHHGGNLVQWALLGKPVLLLEYEEKR